MNRLARRSLIGTGILVAAWLIVAAGIALLLDVNRHKPAIEAAVSQSLGMDFTIGGKVSLRLLPRARLILPDVRLSDGKQEILTADFVRAAPRWIPFLLERKVVVDRVFLERQKIRFEQSSQAAPGPESGQDTAAVPHAMSVVAIRHGDVTYVDRTSGRSVELGDLDLKLTDIAWGSGAARQPLAVLKSASFRGIMRVRTLRLGPFEASNLKCTIKDAKGLLELDPTEIALFGGSAHGRLTLDLTGSSPRVHIVQAASQIDLTQVFPIKIFLGTAQASLDVTGTGSDQRAIMRTMNGQAGIRSEHISVNSLDIDGLIADYDRTQNFSLIDLASLIIAGPFAPLVTKGVDFSRLAIGRMGHDTSEIRRVVSDWTIVDGVAKTKDVAFTTPKHTVAFRGDFDLATGRYQDFFVATVDPQGCAQVKRRVSGPLAHPTVEGPGSATLGPFKSAFRGAKKLFQSEKCDLFYSGSAIH